MKNKKFIIICLTLIITTICICVNTILNKKDNKISLK